MSFLKQLKIYSSIFNCTFLTILTYPFELLITVIEPAIEIGFLVLFWSIIAKAGNHPVNLVSIIAYFILVEFVSIWSLSPSGLNFANYIGYRIKTGQLSQVLVRPAGTLRTLLFENRGYYGVDFIFSILLLFIAIKLNGGTSANQLFWFVIFLALAFSITFSFCVLLGSIAFVTKEINSIRHSFSHLLKILSGAWVPLSFFPEKTHRLLDYTPFPSMMYTPINIIQNKLPLDKTIFNFEVSFMWAIALFGISILVWKHNIKKYEATGI